MNQINKLAAAVTAVTIMVSSAAFAQEIEEIVVSATPIRDSQEAAIEAKRAAVNVMDIVAADTIGRFPDQNLADSLGRVSGLAIERDQGQARFINFRGAPFRYTAIAFDGVDVPGAENGRIPRFDSFPSTITSRLEVNKAITPDMPGEAVAGFVNIATFSPFDKEGFSIGAEYGQGNQDLGDEDIDKYNARISWSDDVFGVLGFYSHNKRGRITDNRELELEETPDGLLANNLDFRSYRGSREDNSWGGTLEMRPEEGYRFFVSTLYSEFIDEEERNQFDFDIADGADITGVPVTPGSGYAPLVLVTRALEDGIYENSTHTSTVGADLMVAEWDIELRANFTETESLTDLPLPFSVGAPIAGSYDVTNPEDPIFIPYVTGTQTPIDVNTLAYAADLGILFYSELNNEAWKFKFDAGRDLNMFDNEARLKLGVQIDTKEAEGGSVTQFVGWPDTVVINDFVTGDPWDSDFSNTMGGRNFDNRALRDAWEAAAGPLTATPTEDSLIAIEEDISAVYAMVTNYLSWGDVTWGMRYEYTDYSSKGSLLVDGVAQATSVSKDFNHFLPSAHLNYDFNEDMKVRFSVSTGVSRPTYTEWRASATVDPINFEVDGGNPALDPEEAWGFDASYEWYYAPASLVSAGFFYRSVDNVIYADTSIIADGSSLAPGVIAPGTPITYNSFFNGDDGELTGFELGLISQFTGALEGFGVSGNVTWLDSEFSAPTKAGETFDLPGTSDLIYNASIYFERWGLSARINYQYRDAWLSTTENDSLSEYWDEQERIDASVRYTLPMDYEAQITLFANFNNIDDYVDVRYVNTNRTPNQVEGYGERWLFGVRVDY